MFRSVELYQHALAGQTNARLMNLPLPSFRAFYEPVLARYSMNDVLASPEPFSFQNHLLEVREVKVVVLRTEQ